MLRLESKLMRTVVVAVAVAAAAAVALLLVVVAAAAVFRQACYGLCLVRLLICGRPREHSLLPREHSLLPSRRWLQQSGDEPGTSEH